MAVTIFNGVEGALRRSHVYRVLALLVLVARVLADCECGYSTSINSTVFTFTDLIETDFLHLSDVKKNTDWVSQAFNVSAAASRGAYGTSFQVENIASNPLADNSSWAGPGKSSPDPGLQMQVKRDITGNGLVPTAELDSGRTDILYGSFRTAFKVTNVSGTCGAFFWYFNDSQEIDIEFLSHQFDHGKNLYPVNLVMQSSQSAAQGYQSAGKNFVIANLTFDPTAGYHEYRFDFVPGNVVFYADGKVLAYMPTTVVPINGHIILTHWSNGNEGWSYGPPAVDATLSVSYVKAYFNSSSEARNRDLASRCKSPTGSAVCAIPDQTVAPDPLAANGNTVAATFFFMNQINTTNNQTVYHQSAASRNPSTWVLTIVTTLALTFAMSPFFF